MALVKPPVCRVTWKDISRLRRWAKTFLATRRMAFCATLAKTAFRSSEKSVEKIRARPTSEHPQPITRRRIMEVSQPTMAVPATVHTVCSVVSSARGMLSESTMLLK
jgi:hypothetical protein